MVQLLNVREASRLLRISSSNLYSLASRNAVPHVRVGARLLFSEPLLEQWVAEQTQGVRR